MLLLSVSLGLICLAPKTASAEDDVYRGYKPRVVPECKVYKTKDGKEVCGYEGIELVKKLYAADAELFWLRKEILNRDQRQKMQDMQSADLRIAVDGFKKSSELCTTRSDTLTKELLATDLKYQKERVKPRWGTTLSWGTAGIAGALLVGFVGHSLLVE